MTFQSNRYKQFSLPIIIFLLSANLSAQAKVPVAQEDFTWWYITLFLLIAALGVAVFFLMKKKKAAKADESKEKAKDSSNALSDSSHTFDADEAMEWLRKSKESANKKRKKAALAKEMAIRQMAIAPSDKNDAVSASEMSSSVLSPVNSFEALNSLAVPVFDFVEIKPTEKYEPLPYSNDGALLSAIEQAQDEYEEDEEVRHLALRIFAAFKTSNSVESLSQLAIYDLSSLLRSKAVSILAEFNHESVFESVLLACADPTREVRAAAARAFSRLDFDRAAAWTRIIESGDKGRIVQSARAAIEGGFVERAFDRLVHRDEKYAYEAFVLTALAIIAGETDPVYNAVKRNNDTRVKLAIIHVLSVIRGENAMQVLYKLLEEKDLEPKVKEAVDKAIEKTNLVAA